MSILQDKSFAFAVKIVKLYQDIQNTRHEFVLIKQILRSGTSIGANIREANYAQSTADMISKFSIALKENHETSYWLELLKETDYLGQEQFDDLYSDCVEIRKMLISSINTLKNKKNEQKD